MTERELDALCPPPEAGAIEIYFQRAMLVCCAKQEKGSNGQIEHARHASARILAVIGFQEGVLAGTVDFVRDGNEKVRTQEQD